MARDPYKYFRVEARELADQLGQSLLELERVGSTGEVVPRLLRLAHTLKGAARVVRLPEIADRAHSIEDLLGPFRDTATAVPQAGIEALLTLLDEIAGKVAALTPPEAPSNGPSASPSGPDVARSLRSDGREIDDLIEGVTEANVELRGLRDIAGKAARARRLSEQILEQLAEAASTPRPSLPELTQSAELLRALMGQIERGVASTHERVDREMRQVRDAAEQLRLVPAGALFANFERAARDSAQLLGKDVVFASKGGEIRLDGSLVRPVQDAVVQLVRNAVAHGIEMSRERLAAGKPATGRVEVTVLRRGRRIVFRCSDDGRGIDTAALQSAAARRGRSAADIERLRTAGLVDLLLNVGASTSAVVTEVAGRGIGMDIVRDAVRQLGAEFEVETEAGTGTTFELIVPLSVSAVEALVLDGGSIRASLPLFALRTTQRLEPADIHRTALGEVIIYDGSAIPLVSLNQLLTRAPSNLRPGNVSAVVVAGAGGFAAVAVAQLPGTANIVFKSLPALAPATAVIAGASFDSDGNPLLMLDPDGLVAAAMHQREPAQQGILAAERLLVIDDSLTTRMLEQNILESAGYEVDTATSAEEGLQRLRQRDYMLILVDVEMPGMDGFTFIEHIRADPRSRDIPAILVTSRNAPEDRRRGEDVGAQGYVVKSEFDQGELLEHIRRLVA